MSPNIRITKAILHEIRFSDRYKYKPVEEIADEFNVTVKYIEELLRGRIRPEKGYKYTKAQKHDRFKVRGPGANRDGVIKDNNEKVLKNRFACPVCGCICHSNNTNSKEYSDYFASQTEADKCCRVVFGTVIEKLNSAGRGRQRGSFR